MLQSHFYPVHTQIKAPKYPFCRGLTVPIHRHLVHPKRNSDNDTRTAHSQLAYQALYAVQHTRWRPVKTNEVPVFYLHLPPPESWPSGCQSHKGDCLVMGKAAVVGPVDRERGRFHFFTIWMTSSSSNVWSLPTFWGLCFTERPQTRALYGREKRTVSKIT